MAIGTPSVRKTLLRLFHEETICSIATGKVGPSLATGLPPHHTPFFWLTISHGTAAHSTTMHTVLKQYCTGVPLDFPANATGGKRSSSNPELRNTLKDSPKVLLFSFLALYIALPHRLSQGVV